MAGVRITLIALAINDLPVLRYGYTLAGKSMTNPLGLPALISPYPGGKSGGRYFRKVSGHVQSLICDRLNYYDVIVEPFAGSGATVWQHSHGATSAIAADIDPGVQSVWECWQDRDGDRATVLSLLEWHKEQIIKDPECHFETLIDNSNKQYFCMGPAAAAASFLTLKRLVFGGVLRCNKEGALNVALSADKLQQYLSGWQYQWPDNGIESLTFRHSWQEAVEALASSSHERALVVIDSPYWTPEKKMTEAYAHHGDPGSYEVMSLAVDCLDAVLATGKAKRIVVFNYYSEALNKAIQEMVSISTYDCHVSNLSPLSTMNNGQGTEYHEYYSEAVWEIGGRRMFRDHDAVEQLSLV